MYQALEQQDLEVEGSSSDFKIRVVWRVFNLDQEAIEHNKGHEDAGVRQYGPGKYLSNLLDNVSLHEQVNVPIVRKSTSSKGTQIHKQCTVLKAEKARGMKQKGEAGSSGFFKRVRHTDLE